MTPPLLETASKLLPRMVDELLHCTRGRRDVNSNEGLSGKSRGAWARWPRGSRDGLKLRRPPRDYCGEGLAGLNSAVDSKVWVRQPGTELGGM